jgi:hypothetical protein
VRRFQSSSFFARFFPLLLSARERLRDLREKANRFFRSLFSLSFSLVARDDAAVRV